MDVLNLVVSLLSLLASVVLGILALLATVVLGVLAYLLQRASAARERREDRRSFGESVDEWARMAEDELLRENPRQQAQYLRMSLTSDMKPVAKMRPEFLVQHVERALAEIGQVSMESRPVFVESVRAMRRANIRRWVVDPETTEENEAHYAVAASSVDVTLSATAKEDPGQGLGGTGRLDLI